MKTAANDNDGLALCASLLSQQEWVFAKTMPRNPHWYTLRRKWVNDSEFIWVVTFIRRHGYIEWFHRRPYTMLYLGEMKYWTMGSPIEETILINRAKIAADRVFAGKGWSVRR